MLGNPLKYTDPTGNTSVPVLCVQAGAPFGGGVFIPTTGPGGSPDFGCNFAFNIGRGGFNDELAGSLRGLGSFLVGLPSLRPCKIWR